MIVRSYTGRTVPEALEKVKNDLGDNALIIETRAIREPGLLGRRSGYEVVAAADFSTTNSSNSNSSASVASATSAARANSLVKTIVPSAMPEPEIKSWHAPTLQAPIANQAASLARERAEENTSIALEEELASIRKQLARLAQGQGTPHGHLPDDIVHALEDGEMPGEITAELDDAIARTNGRLDNEKYRDFLNLLMARNLPCAGAIDWDTTHKLMLIGPTGVGKTTTLAKLAGDLVLKQNRRVALITIDTYRVGAQEQLKTYADLLDIPLEIATTPAQFGALVRRYESYDNILIDTAGRSPSDTTRIHELKAFCRACTGLGVMLAIAANSGRTEFAAVVERFSILPIAHAVVTKLDECVAFGRLYGCLRRHRLPINYLTYGQEVPNDIIAADSQTLTSRILSPNAALTA
jgi:flagellar biosynthesis protein FlhF